MEILSLKKSFENLVGEKCCPSPQIRRLVSAHDEYDSNNYELSEATDEVSRVVEWWCG